MDEKNININERLLEYASEMIAFSEHAQDIETNATCKSVALVISLLSISSTRNELKEMLTYMSNYSKAKATMTTDTEQKLFETFTEAANQLINGVSDGLSDPETQEENDKKENEEAGKESN